MIKRSECSYFSARELIKVEPLFLDISNTFTYEFWVKPESDHQIVPETNSEISGIQGQRFVIGPTQGRIDGEVGVGISVGINGVSVFEHSDCYFPATLVYVETCVDWVHIAIVYDQKTPTLFINGKYKKTGMTSTKDMIFPSGLIGGGEHGAFIGFIRDLRIWNYARSSAQINKDYQRELTGSESGLCGYWKLLQTGEPIEYDFSPKQRHGIIITNPIPSPLPDSHCYSLNDQPFVINHLDYFERFIFGKNRRLEELRSSLRKRYATDVLIIFGYYRYDYEDLIYPVVNELARQGVSVTMLLPRNALDRFANANIDSRVQIVCREEFYEKYRVSFLGEHYYKNTLIDVIQKWCKMMGLHPDHEEQIKNFYFNYAIEFIGTSILLHLFTPKCVYGIHYILSPGVHDALKSIKEKNPLIVILIQHGLFYSDDNPYHDFKGADLVILWGNYHARLLEKLTNSPPYVVLGNPKLEVALQKLNNENGTIKLPDFGITKILYLSAFSPKLDLASKESLQLFLEGTRTFKNVDITIRLRPDEPIEHYDEFFASNQIQPKQISINTDLFMDINQADIIVDGISTSIFEAAVLRKPVIQIKTCKSVKTHYVFQQANSAHELRSIIDRIRTDQTYRNQIIHDQNQLLNELFYEVDGSSQRIAHYIRSLL
jgi:hypothetical protein